MYYVISCATRRISRGHTQERGHRGGFPLLIEQKTKKSTTKLSHARRNPEPCDEYYCHIAVPVGSNSPRTYAPCCMQAALAIAMVCFGLDFVSLFFGLSIFMMKVRRNRGHRFKKRSIQPVKRGNIQLGSMHIDMDMELKKPPTSDTNFIVPARRYWSPCLSPFHYR